MTEKELFDVEKKIGYTFQNKSLLEQAFLRSSYVNELKQKNIFTVQSNEVLEFLGDAVLSSCLAYLLLQKNGKIQYNSGFQSTLVEEDFTVYKSHMSDKTALAQIVRDLSINQYLQMSKGDINQNVLAGNSPNEDLFESIIGAVALDCQMNYEILLPLIDRLDHVERLLEKEIPKSPKSQVKEYCEKKGISQTYTVLKTEGPDHNLVYTVSLSIDGMEPILGTGKNKKAAETDAAKKALLQIELPS